jgi:O-antigen ligase
MSLALISKPMAKGIRSALLLGGVAGIGLALLLTQFDSEILLPFPFLVLAVCAFIRYPELPFAVFLNTGVLKADPRLMFLPNSFDLTAMFALASIVGVAYGLMMKRIKFVIPSMQVLVPYCIIVLLGMCSLTYTLAPIYGTDKLLRFITLTSLAWFLPFFVFQENASITRFFTVFVVLALLMILDVVRSGLVPGRMGFISAFGSNYLALGTVLGFSLIVVSFYYLMRAQKRVAKFFYLCLVPPLLAGMLLSGGRGPVIALLLSVLAIGGCMGGMVGKRILTFSGSVTRADVRVLTLVGMLIIISAAVAISFSDYFQTLFMRLELAREGGGLSVLTRVDMFKRAIEVMKSVPSGLVGLGIGGFSMFYGGFDDARGLYPHNLFLELGSELGVLGLFASLLLVYWAACKVLLLARQTQADAKYLGITLLGLLVFFVSSASVSGDLNDNRLLFLCIGMIHAL